MIRTRQARSNDTQAVRLPPDVAVHVSVREVVILRDGAGRVPVPAGSASDDCVAAPVTAFANREQLPARIRAVPPGEAAAACWA